MREDKYDADADRAVRASVVPERIGGQGSERDTRAHVARLLLEFGPATAAALGERLGLTSAAVRRHLDALLADGMIETRAARPRGPRGRGRPARLFAITDSGRSAFYHAYDDTAASALRFISEKLGEGAVVEFARRQVHDLERRYGARLRAVPVEQRLRVLAEALSSDGYAASAGQAPRQGVSSGFIPPTSSGGTSTGGYPVGEQLCQHHCPVAHVAAEFPELCEAETEAFARMLGTPVQRLATIAHGDGVCTTHVTPRDLGKRDGKKMEPEESGRTST